MKDKKFSVVPYMKKSIFVALFGHILERYEVTLYGFLSTLLVPLFFPQQNSTLAFLFGMGAFAAGYIMRPIGGLFFGYIGDKYGRKTSLLGSILLVSFPTFIIGILPTYNQIGLLAPTILICCRLLQGLCVGGEYSGATVYFYESCSPSKTGFFGSIMSATAFVGAIVGSLAGTLITLPFMPEWCWRITFLLGSVLGIIGFFVRRSMRETPAYTKKKICGLNKKEYRNPLITIIKKRMRNVLCTMAIGATGYICLYISTIYTNTIFSRALHLSSFHIMSINTFILFLWVIFMLIFGYISDYIGKRRILYFSVISIILISFPFFYLISNFPKLHYIFLFQITLSFFGAGVFGITPGFVPALFDVGERYSGVAAGLNIGQAIFGGTAPFIATLLVFLTGNECMPALLLILSGAIGWIAVKCAVPLDPMENEYKLKMKFWHKPKYYFYSPTHIR